ncbi:alpha/beta fold hydrolase [Jiella sonneratiae]|uniref:Alpha/beta fold hydrolase n=1 Tax=Jiella sonneratiae TaxID=2816856 RepID=A0ABS3J8U7_9HYPH|nr:alpha/beta fold hydrolase [Jiella sonneratiae]MBO0906089.1 alpha/beta fold hydrolase [Jiella sonneratiae]
MLLWTNGRKIYYDVVGPADAPVVYFAHSLAADSGMWSDQVPAFLAAGYRVLRADMRGHGGSDVAPGNYRMEQLIADAVLLLDHLEIAKVHFCGLSIGGMIAQGLGILHPERVASLVLCDTQSQSPADARERWGKRTIVIQDANSMAPLAEATMGRWLSAEFKQRHPNLWQQVHDTVAATPVQGYIGCAAAIQDFDWTPRLPEIAAPALVLYGTEDPAAHPQDNQKIADALQNGELLALEGARHLPNMEDPDRFNRIVIDWCNRWRG